MSVATGSLERERRREVVPPPPIGELARQVGDARGEVRVRHRVDEAEPPGVRQKPPVDGAVEQGERPGCGGGNHASMARAGQADVRGPVRRSRGSDRSPTASPRPRARRAPRSAMAAARRRARVPSSRPRPTGHGAGSIARPIARSGTAATRSSAEYFVASARPRATPATRLQPTRQRDERSPEGVGGRDHERRDGHVRGDEVGVGDEIRIEGGQREGAEPRGVSVERPGPPPHHEERHEGQGDERQAAGPEKSLRVVAGSPVEEAPGPRPMLEPVPEVMAPLRTVRG